VRLHRPGDVGTVLRVLYLVFNEVLRRRRPGRRGHPADRQLAAVIDHPRCRLLALMLLHHARRASRTTPTAAWYRSPTRTAAGGTHLIAEGVAILQAALARDRLGEFQAQAAIAALHADAPTAREADWVQIVEWYDELAG